MEIKIRTDRERYYYQVLRILQTVPGYSLLTEREAQILALLMKTRDSIDQMEVTEQYLKESMLFSRQTKDTICAKLGLDDASYRNHLSHMRRKRFIRGTRINLPSEIKYLEPVHFEFSEHKVETKT